MARTTAAARQTASTRSNILFNGNFEIAPTTLTAPTNTPSRWVDGTAGGSSATTGLGWGIVSFGASAQAGWDNTVAHSGTYSMKLSTLNNTGSLVLAVYAISPTGLVLFPLLPSTTYTLTGWIKTNNVATNGAWIDLREYNSAAGNLGTTSSTKLSGTNAFTQVTFSVTTNASTAYGTIFLRNGVTGNIGDAWFDDITLVLVSAARSAAGSRSAA